MPGKMTVTCSRCGEKRETDTFGRINVAENPELKERVKDGSLFLWECPHCGTENLVRFQTLYHDPKSKLMIWLLPDGIVPENQVDTLGRQLEETSDLMEGYSLRRVKDIGSLIEKVNIFDAGLDDVVMEICKYVTGMEMAKNEVNKAFKFFKIDGPDHDIILSYPENGQMQGVKIGFNVYEDCAGILRRNPSLAPKSGFPIVDSDWIGRFFR